METLTPIASIAPAAALVLDTPELLEMILSNLPPLQLLVLQRVSSVWHSLISTSPPIQRALFMRPDWTLEAKPFNAWQPGNRPGERPRNNRMLRRVLDGMYPTVTLKVTNAGDEAVDSTTEIVDVPDTDFELGPRGGRSSSSSSSGGSSGDNSKGDPKRGATGHWSWDVNITFPADRLPTTDPAVLYAGASWRSMFICQPPCTTLHLVRRWQRAADPAIECPGGITMDVFMAKATKAKEAWNQLFIASDRDWHFEGPIRCSKIEKPVRQEITKANREVVYDQYVLERLYGTGYLANHH
ncbi:hypothetical protein MBLNU459_g4970t1 [Dothideomycetes sp. NU459]